MLPYPRKKAKQTGPVALGMRAALSRMTIEKCDVLASGESSCHVGDLVLPRSPTTYCDLLQSALISCSQLQPPAASCNLLLPAATSCGLWRPSAALCYHNPWPAKIGLQTGVLLLDLATIFISDEYAWHVTQEGKHELLSMLRSPSQDLRLCFCTLATRKG